MLTPPNIEKFNLEQLEEFTSGISSLAVCAEMLITVKRGGDPDGKKKAAATRLINAIRKEMIDWARWAR